MLALRPMSPLACRATSPLGLRPTTPDTSTLGKRGIAPDANFFWAFARLNGPGLPHVPVFQRAASERKENILKGFEDLCLQANARIWT